MGVCVCVEVYLLFTRISSVLWSIMHCYLSVITMDSTLKIYYQNVRGLRTKTNAFYKNLLQVDYDVICLSETWLHENIFSAELFDSRYSVYRCDHSGLEDKKYLLFFNIAKCLTPGTPITGCPTTQVSYIAIFFVSLVANLRWYYNFSNSSFVSRYVYHSALRKQFYWKRR